MLFKIILYFIIMIGGIISQYKYGMLDRLGVSGNIFVLLLFAVYILMLCAEVKPKIVSGWSYKEIRRAGFIFSFWIGIIWGIIYSFSHGAPKFKSLPLIIMFLGGYVFAGLIFGVIGWGLASLMWKYVSKKV